MKANVANLRKALKASAKAHNVNFEDWSDEGQFGLESEAVPVVADARMIAEAFYGDPFGLVETGWGYTTIWAVPDEMMRDVNVELLKMALPYGTRI